MDEVMRRWLLVLAVSVASATASAEPRQATPPAAVTASAESATKSAERLVAQLTVVRQTLAKRYQDQLDQIDRLKNQRVSWRRDRELRDSLSESLETANLLSAATRDLERAKADLETARRSYLAAIDAEIAAAPAPTRLQWLTRARTQLSPQVKAVPRRIVIPDFDIDPLADPEELDQRAAELRASEEELGRQLAGLKAQAAELDHLALLRKQHDRAGDLFNRDDDEPHRNAARAGGEASSEEAGSAGKPSGGAGIVAPNFENLVPIVLADVIDAWTIGSLEAAQRSGDPTQRADAARLAGNQVARRLAEIRKRRLELETRARELRSAH
jgi:hypothetical protein